MESVTQNDRCSETDMTDGERRKRRMFDNLYPSSMKGRQMASIYRGSNTSLFFLWASSLWVWTSAAISSVLQWFLPVPINPLSPSNVLKGNTIQKNVMLYTPHYCCQGISKIDQVSYSQITVLYACYEKRFTEVWIKLETCQTQWLYPCCCFWTGSMFMFRFQTDS